MNVWPKILHLALCHQPPLPSGASRVSSLDRHPFLQRFHLLAARPDGDPSLWPSVSDKTQELVVLLRSIRGLHATSIVPCTLPKPAVAIGGQLAVSVRKASQTPSEQMPVVYSLSHTGKGCDIFS